MPLLLESRATAPEPPTNVRATAVDATSARIAFTPGFDNGSKATQYRVLYARADKLEAEAADGAVGNHGREEETRVREHEEIGGVAQPHGQVDDD